MRTASTRGVVLRLDRRSLKILCVDVVRARAHVACAASSVRHAAICCAGSFGFLEHRGCAG